MRRFVVLFAIAAVGMSGCSTAVMSVPEDLHLVSPMEVSGSNPRRWNAPLSFGEWRTAEVHEGLRWGFGAPILNLDVGLFRQASRLVIENPNGDLIQGECVTRALQVGRDGWSVDPSFGAIPALACGFRDLGSGEEWSLKLRPRGWKLEGELDARGGRPLSVRSLHTLEGSRVSSAEPIGFELVGNGRTMGAVEIVNRGRVWIDPVVGEREAARLASAAMALLLFEPPPDLDD